MSSLSQSCNFRLRVLLLPLLSLLLIGCAVTTIDVDVYKGPLVNDEGVQTEQTAALAIGAKPLIVQLRDELEWEGRRRPSVYQADYMRDYDWQDDLARRANAILSLYEDRLDERLASLVSTGDEAAEQYRDAYHRFREADTQEQDAWKLLQNYIRIPDGNDRCSTGIQELKRGYEMLFQRTGPYQREKQYEQWIVLGHMVLFRADPKRCPAAEIVSKFNLTPDLYPDKRIVDLGQIQNPNASENDEIIPPNAAFKRLADPEFVNAHANILIPDKGEDADNARKIFLEYVTRVGRNFARGRNALSQLLHATLNLIIQVGSASDVSAVASNKLLRLSKLVATVMDGHRLAEALITDETSGVVPPYGLKDFAMRLESRLRSANVRLADVAKGGRDEAAFEDAVVSELVERPVPTADFILQADHFYREVDDVTSQRAALLRVDQPRSARKYGLVTGPVRAASDFAENVLKDWQGSTRSLGAVGLAEGRLDIGLNRLIENYIKLAYQGRTDPTREKDAASERKRLLDGLVQFSEKILFIANNTVLLGSEMVRRPETRPAAPSDAPAEPTGASSTARSRDYARVLQAVGNSILVQVDELRHQSNYHEADLKAGGIEAQAVRSVDPALSKPPTSQPIGSTLEGGLALPASAKEITRRQVMDELLAKLRYEYVQVVRSNGSKDDRAQYLLDAIQFLYRERAGAVYIRPPAAFLRDSYPVTSLQSTSQGLWTNELSREAARGMPFVEFFRDQVVYKEQSHDAWLQKQIDKQFWQNINHIRVAGTGRTNYVIAKDDVGNWYVKGYSADPRDIIESARAMAGFAIGSPVSSGAIEAAMQGKKAVDPQGNKVTDNFNTAAHDNPATQPSKGNAPSAAEQRAQNTALHTFQMQQFDRVQVDYRNRLKALDDRITLEATQLNNAVEVAWKNRQIMAPVLFQAAEAVASTKHVAAIPTSDDPAKYEADIREKLQGMKSYRDELLKKIYSLPPSTQPYSDATASAAAAASAPGTATAIADPQSPTTTSAKTASAPAAAATTTAATTTSAGGGTIPASGSIPTTSTIPSVATPPPASAPATQPAAQPPPPCTQPVLNADQMKLAFRTAAETIRDKLEPLLQDGLAVSRTYEAELNVLKGSSSP